MKKCPICGDVKSSKEFHVRGPLRDGEVSGYCKTCSSVRRKRERQDLKLEIFNAYGGPFCRCCGENGSLAFLALDHINNDGAKERKMLGRSHSGALFYSYLKKKGYPKGYQVLCHTCNVAKQILGICPHKLVDSVNGNTSPSEGEDSRSKS